jgi:hypothetical protein
MIRSTDDNQFDDGDQTTDANRFAFDGRDWSNFQKLWIRDFRRRLLGV